MKKLDTTKELEFVADIAQELLPKIKKGNQEFRKEVFSGRTSEMLTSMNKLLDVDDKFQWGDTFKGYTKEQRKAYVFVAKNLHHAIKLNKENGYHKLITKKDGSTENKKVDFYSGTSMEGLEKMLRRYIAYLDGPSAKSYQSFEKLIDHVVEHVQTQGYNYKELVECCAQLLGFEIDSDSSDINVLELDPLTIEKKSKKVA